MWELDHKEGWGLNNSCFQMVMLESLGQQGHQTSQPQKKLALNIQEWDVWMASPKWWTWVWANSGSWWWTGKPGVLQFMGPQRVGHNWTDWSTEESQYSWESLGSLEVKPLNPEGNQPWIFTGRTDAEAEVPILWSLDGKYWLIRKDLDAGKDWGQEEKGITEDEMVY